MPDRRPFGPADDRWLLAADADGLPYQEMAKVLRRSVASIRGRINNLRAEGSRSERATTRLRKAGA